MLYGRLTFDSTLQKKYPYCGSEIDVESLTGLDKDLNHEPASDTGRSDLRGNV